MRMDFKITDLEKIPGPSGSRCGGKTIKLNKAYLYFSGVIVEDLDLKEGDTCDLRMMPNNKGFLIDPDGNSFTFRRANKTQRRRWSLSLSGRDMWEYLKNKFDTKEFSYERVDGYVIVYPIKEAKANAEQ